jgi:hypothetical protein
MLSVSLTGSGEINDSWNEVVFPIIGDTVRPDAEPRRDRLVDTKNYKYEDHQDHGIAYTIAAHSGFYIGISILKNQIPSDSRNFPNLKKSSDLLKFSMVTRAELWS